MLVQNYSDLTLDNMVLDGSKLGGEGRYTLSNNCGEVLITGKTKIIAEDNGIAFDACEYASYPVPTVTVDGNAVVEGKMEVTGDANLVIKGGTFTDLANAVKYAENDAKITLLKDVEGAGIVIDKDITIDFDGNTYDIVGPAVGSAGTTTLGFQILSGNDVVLKDGTIKESAPAQNGENETNKAVKMLVQNYSNLTLDNMVLDGSELGGEGRYTLSNNCGNIVIKGGTEIIAAADGIAFDVCKYASYEVPTVTIEDAFVKGAFEVSEGLKSNLIIYAGYFTQNPADYVVEGKDAIASTKSGYNYMIGEKQLEVDTKVSVGEPEVKVDPGIGLTPEMVADAIKSEETADDLGAIAGKIANDHSVITENVIAKAAEKLKTDEVTIIVEPYLDVEVKSVTEENGVVEMTLEITPKFNLIAEADGEESVTVAEGQDMTIEKGEVITIVVPVPDDFAGSKLYIRHVKSNGKVYIYEATVADGKATFDNPNGFSEFILTTVAPAAQIGEVGYATLAAAVADVENGQTIKLLADCGENVSVSRDVTFALDKNAFAFTGSIHAGANTTETVNGNEYTFDYTAPAKKKSAKYDVIVKSDANGKAEVNDDYAKRGQEIIITVTPDKGYELDELTVIADSGKEIDVEETKNGKYTFEMPKSDVTVKVSFEKADDADEDKKADAEDTEAAESKDTVKTVLSLTIDQRVYKLNGNYAANDVAPIISGNRTFLPIRLIAESLGATVTWNGEVQSVTIEEGDTIIVIYIGQAFATVNGEPVQLDAPAFIANDRTYLPVRFVAENLGATVSWDAETKEVTIIG